MHVKLAMPKHPVLRLRVDLFTMLYISPSYTRSARQYCSEQRGRLRFPGRAETSDTRQP